MGYEAEGVRLYSSEELAEAATQARGDMTQKDVAEILDVTKQSVSKAENRAVGSKMNGLRIRIIRQIGGRDVEGPYWVVQPIDEEEKE